MEQKTLRENIARVLLMRRNSLSQTVLQGEMRKELGAEAFAESLRLRWLVTDAESGFLQITNDRQALDRMRKVVEAAGPPAAIGDVVLVADQGSSFQGTVSKINPDGTYTVSFGTNRPRVVRNYAGSEIRKVANATMQKTPGAAPTPVAPPAAAAGTPAVAPATGATPVAPR